MNKEMINKIRINQLNPMYNYRFKKLGDNLVMMTEGVSRDSD